MLKASQEDHLQPTGIIALTSQSCTCTTMLQAQLRQLCSACMTSKTPSLITTLYCHIAAFAIGELSIKLGADKGLQARRRGAGEHDFSLLCCRCCKCMCPLQSCNCMVILQERLGQQPGAGNNKYPLAAPAAALYKVASKSTSLPACKLQARW